MRLKTDYRKLKAAFTIGLLLCLLSILTLLYLEGSGQIIWTGFLNCSGFLFVIIGIFIKSRFELTDEFLIIKNIVGLGNNRIPITSIKRIKYTAKDYPAAAQLMNPLWLILRDKKFKQNKQLDLYGDKEKIARIDGHLLDDRDFEKLKKKLKKACVQHRAAVSLAKRARTLVAPRNMNDQRK